MTRKEAMLIQNGVYISNALMTYKYCILFLTERFFFSLLRIGGVILNFGLKSIVQYPHADLMLCLEFKLYILN